MQRILTVALGVVIALAALAATSAQQEPPHRFYGSGATAGDTIGVHANDDDLTLLNSATVAEDGTWYVDVDRDDAEDVVFSINGEVAEGEAMPTGGGQTSVSGLAVAEAMLDEGMEGDEDGEMMDEDGEMMDEDGEMMDEDESMMEDEDSMMDEGDTGYPATGTGGLASDGGVSAGLIGLLIALVTVSVAGLGLRRIRNRA